MFYDPIAHDNRDDLPHAAGVVPASSGAPAGAAGGAAAGSAAPGSCFDGDVKPVSAGGPADGCDALAGRLAVLVDEFDSLADRVLSDGASGRDAAALVPLIARIERRASSLGVVVGGRAVAAQRREEGGDRIAAEWIAGQTSSSRREAEAAFKLLDGFAAHGSTRAAFEAGDLTRHQTALVLAAAVADPGCEDDMLALAGRGPVEDLARESRQRVREARRETPEQRAARHRRSRRLWTGTDEDGAFTGGFSTDAMQGATLNGNLELWTEALFRRDRRLGVRNKNQARRLDALVVMSQIATGATPGQLGFDLSDLPAALRPRQGNWIGEPARPDEPDGSGERACGFASGGDPADAGPPATSGDPPTSGGGSGSDGGPPGAGEPGRPDGRPRYRPRGPADPVIHIHIDIGALRRGQLLPGERCEIPGVGPVSIAEVRELIPAAALKLILEHGRDVYNVTHLRRTMTAHQKTAVLAMYQQCCVTGCGSRVGLQDDHQVPWAQTRHTWAPGMHPICPHHHDRKTHHGWDFVAEPPDPVTGLLRLVPPDHPDHPDNKATPRPMPPEQPTPAHSAA